eukprot:scaffold19910_cov51-Attheya_sp.AAC.3
MLGRREAVTRKQNVSRLWNRIPGMGVRLVRRAFMPTVQWSSSRIGCTNIFCQVNAHGSLVALSNFANAGRWKSSTLLLFSPPLVIRHKYTLFDQGYSFLPIPPLPTCSDIGQHDRTLPGPRGVSPSRKVKEETSKDHDKPRTPPNTDFSAKKRIVLQRN